MSATPKKKLCWNCDGNVPLAAEHCPYCGVYIERTAADLDHEEEESDIAPPYAMASSSKTQRAETPASPFAALNAERKSSMKVKPAARQSAAAVAQAPDVIQAGDARQVVLSLVCLLAGSIFLLFGLVLFLFSDNGIFTLRWDGDYWLVYFVCGLIALFLGWRTVTTLDQT